MYTTGTEVVVEFEQFITLLSTLTRGSVEQRVHCVYRLYDMHDEGCIQWTRM
jgi:Ca2+-binding EF-hand superfamily protein